MAIYLCGSLGPQTIDLASNVTVVYPNGTWVSTLNSTSVMTEPTEAQKTFSLQTLTTVSTLAVAIASFYFGAKAVKTARKDEEVPPEQEDEEEVEEEPEAATAEAQGVEAGESET